METNANYAIVGVFVTALLVLAIAVGLWLSAGIKSKDYNVYQVYMDESVAGLSENAPVKFNGVNVGTVESIHLNLKDPQQVILTLEIEPEIPITESTTAILMEQGITGIAYIGLKGGKKAPLLKAKSGQKYPIIPSRPSFLVKLDKTIGSISDNFGDMSLHVRELLSERNIESVQGLLSNVNKVSKVIAHNSENIASSLKDLKIVLNNAARASRQFPNIMDAIGQSSKAIQKASAELNLTAQNVNKVAEQGDITLQSFSNDILPITYTTIKNIKDLTDNLKGFSTELKQNPAIIFKGTRPPKPGPGE